MRRRRPFGKYVSIVFVLLLGVWWSVASALQEASERAYPGKSFLATPTWVAEHKDDPDVILVDLREDKYFDHKVIPGAIRLPWGEFRYNDDALGIGGLFVGTKRAQEIFGSHGISRRDTIVLYDSVERDGGATASYVFWILDLLGHEKKRVLERGIDGWIDSGAETAPQPRILEPVLYQAPAEEIDLAREVDGRFIYTRLGDPYCQIIDVRSAEEYRGEKPNTGLTGEVLKLGHIPTSVNVDYRLNWADAEKKTLKSYKELQLLFRGLNPSRAVVVYCHSARRSSFAYFVLRLMGLKDVRVYDRSWFEWGNWNNYFPVETRENQLQGSAPAEPGAEAEKGTPSPRQTAKESLEESDGGYVSCGG
jgi:thiosulfate/3-mercaptopyruvate sulfurtransferase